MGMSYYDHMLRSSNSYGGAQISGGTHASGGFPFLGGHYPLGGISQFGVTPMPRGISYLGRNDAFWNPFSIASSYKGELYGTYGLNRLSPLEQNSFSNP
jgi:hypothetical protein